MKSSTWPGCVTLSPLGSDAVVPPDVGVVDKLLQIQKQFFERHGRRHECGVVQQGRPPQIRTVSEQDAVQGCQTLLRRVDGTHSKVAPHTPTVPGLMPRVHAAQVVSSCMKIKQFLGFREVNKMKRKRETETDR